MRMRTRFGVRFIVSALALSLIAGQAQRPEPAISATIAEKKPVFAGACKACPWGILAKVTSDALSFYGYRTTICWVCWSSFGPREMGDKTKPVTPSGALDNPEYVEPPPDAVPDISATSESNLNEPEGIYYLLPHRRHALRHLAYGCLDQSPCQPSTDNHQSSHARSA
jgi:hypothetical protein